MPGQAGNGGDDGHFAADPYILPSDHGNDSLARIEAVQCLSFRLVWSLNIVSGLVKSQVAPMSLNALSKNYISS